MGTRGSFSRYKANRVSTCMRESHTCIQNHEEYIDNLLGAPKTGIRSCFELSSKIDIEAMLEAILRPGGGWVPAVNHHHRVTQASEIANTT